MDSNVHVIATIDRRKVAGVLLRFLAPIVIASLLLLLELGILRNLAARKDPTGGRLQSIVPTVVPTAAGFLILVLLTLVLPVVIKQLYERDMAIDGATVATRARRRRLGTIELANIAEVIVRRNGTNPLAFGLDRGMALVLDRPEFVGTFGHRHRVALKIRYALHKYHVLFAPVYREPMEEIATLIAEAAESVRGKPVPIRYTGAGGKPLSNAELIARPLPARAAPVTPPPLECVECGYDLRMHDRTGTCPECGTPVARSLQGDVLENADARWLRSLQFGSVLVVLAALVGIVACWFFDGALVLIVLGRPTAVSWLGWQASFRCGLVLGTIGVLLLTRRSPSPVSLAKDPLSRRLARWALLLPLLSYAFRFAGPWASWLMFLLLPTRLLAVFGTLLWYARHILSRAPMRNWRVFGTLAATACFTACGVWTVVVAMIVASWMIGARNAASTGMVSASQPAPPPADVLRAGVHMFTGVAALFPLALILLFSAMFLRIRASRRGSDALRSSVH